MANQFDINNVFTPDIALKNAVNGIPWLNDTLNGVDIYNGFVKSPTIFFDPGSTATKSQGTYKYPYKTQAELQSVVNGNMVGQVLGFRRGSVLRVSGASGLSLDVYGSAAAPFVICPYGDNLSLPVITAGAIVSWTLYDVANNIWSYATGSQVDVFRSNVRQRKVAYATSVLATLSAVNRSTYTGGVLYLRLPAGEVANDGRTEIQASAYALDLNYSNVSDTGHIHVYGLDLQKGSNCTFGVSVAAANNLIATIDDIEIIGCRVSGAGVDANVNTGSDGLVVYGLSDAIRITNLHIAGCYSEDCLNHAIETSGTDGLVLEKNRSHNIGGHSIVELWSSNSNAIIRYNWGNLSGIAGSIYNSGGAGGGVFFSNINLDTDTFDAANTANVNNSAYFNLITNFRLKAFVVNGGSGHKFYHNTCYTDADVTKPGGGAAAAAWQTNGATAANGFVDISNNIFYWKRGAYSIRYTLYATMNALTGGVVGLPVGGKNVYWSDWGLNNCGWYHGAANIASFTSYKSTIATYSAMDQTSYAGVSNSGGTLTAGGLGFVEPTVLPNSNLHDYEPERAFAPLASAVPGSAALTGIGNKYWDGTPYAAASATIGAFKGY